MPTLAGKPITSNGLGLMRLTLRTGSTPDETAFAVLKAALAAGANVWNGADFYGTPDANSLHLLNRYFTKYPEDADKVVICIKTGVVDMSTLRLDGSPEFMRKSLENCDRILDGKKKIDLFGPARVDPNVPIEETVKGLAELVKEGRISGIQLTEVRAETIRRVAEIHKIDMVEAEVSLWSTDIFSNGVAETCKELDIVVCGHTPLGAGVLTGQIKQLNDLAPDDHRRVFPRFQPEVFNKNIELVKELERLAKEKGCTAPQLALGWIKVQGVMPIAGARTVEKVKENCVDVGLTEADLKEIDGILESFPVVGERFPQRAMVFNEY